MIEVEELAKKLEGKSRTQIIGILNKYLLEMSSTWSRTNKIENVGGTFLKVGNPDTTEKFS